MSQLESREGVVNEPLPIGPRRCRDCRTEIVPPRIWRCATCLKKRIDRIVGSHKQKENHDDRLPGACAT
jgi:hypothetical protein